VCSAGCLPSSSCWQLQRPTHKHTHATPRRFPHLTRSCR
jgi:hypothetical protein